MNKDKLKKLKNDNLINTTFEDYTKYKKMLVFRIKVKKNNAVYEDYWLAWLYNDKIFTSRILPLFQQGYKFVRSATIEVASMSQLMDVANNILKLTK